MSGHLPHFFFEKSREIRRRELTILDRTYIIARE